MIADLCALTEEVVLGSRVLGVIAFLMWSRRLLVQWSVSG